VQDKEKNMSKNILKNIDLNRLPKHIAIIMDGNGRWAQMRGMPRTMGHRAGVEALKKIVRFCNDLGIKYLTVYAFSTENWKRPIEEVSSLMNLLLYYFKKEVDALHKNNVKIVISGNWEELPEKIADQIRKSMIKTQNNSGLILNIALNYGGRSEILFACKNICTDVLNGDLCIDKIDEKLFEQYLYTYGLPDPDLLIRPSGELRISNFLLWQIAYSELWFTQTYWPDFKEEDLICAIYDYQTRERRFGGLKK